MDGPGVRAAALGVIVNAGLAGVKIAIGSLVGSVAVLADGLHSLADMVGSLAVWLGLGISQRPADACHPFGHHKAEAIAGTLVGGLVLVAGANIGYAAVKVMLASSPCPPAVASLVAAGGSIAIKELLSRYQLSVARRLNSSALLASAWEQRADALSSAVVLIGVVASFAGWSTADAAAGFVVSLMIIRIGWGLTRRGVSELMDAAAPPELRATIERVAASVPGVLGTTALRTRKTGRGLFVDVSVRVDGNLSVADGHDLSHRAATAIIVGIDEVVDATVHVEPDRPGAGS